MLHNTHKRVEKEEEGIRRREKMGSSPPINRSDKWSLCRFIYTRKKWVAKRENKIGTKGVFRMIPAGIRTWHRRLPKNEILAGWILKKKFTIPVT